MASGFLGRPARNRRPVRLPGPTKAVGLGDAVAKVTSAVGIKPCGGCNKRKEVLNNAVRFGGKGGE